MITFEILARFGLFFNFIGVILVGFTSFWVVSALFGWYQVVLVLSGVLVTTNKFLGLFQKCKCLNAKGRGKVYRCVFML